MKKIEKNLFFDVDEINSIIKILSSLPGEESRFVGGIVRDLILTKSFKNYDIDIATTITPSALINLFKKTKVDYNMKGFNYGTVNVKINNYFFDITTLRSEINFNGRHPEVEYTKDWSIDSNRRDFTFNAIYIDFEGIIHDPFNGSEDLIEGKVRFIGRPEDRIKEDPLRVLRYFRFLGLFSKSSPDRESVIACSKLSGSIAILSKERITHEFLRILEIPDPNYTIAAMIESGVLQQFFPQASRPDRLEFLYNLEISAGIEPDPILRIASLIFLPDNAKKLIIKKLNKNFTFSKNQKKRLDYLLDKNLSVQEKMSIYDIKKLLFRLGSYKVFFDIIFITWAREGAEKDFRKIIENTAKIDIPILPIKGGDLKKLNVKPENIRFLLEQIEDWWIKSDFTKNKEECILEAKKRIKSDKLL